MKSSSLPIPIHNNITNSESTDDNDNDESMFLIHSPMTRSFGLGNTATIASPGASSIWNCESTTPMTSRPHFCTIQQLHPPPTTTEDTNNVLQHHHWRNYDNERNEDDNAIDVVGDVVLATDDDIDDKYYQLRHSHRRRSRSSSVGTQPPPQYHHQPSHSGDVLLVPSLLTAAYNYHQQQQHHQHHHQHELSIGRDDVDIGNLHTIIQQHDDIQQRKYQQQYDDDDKTIPTASLVVNDSIVPEKQRQQDNDDIRFEDYDTLKTEWRKQQSTSTTATASKTAAATTRAKMTWNTVIICILYGMINATIVIPVLMSFGTIIYRNDAFLPYQANLITLTMVSGIVHQLCITTFTESIPFAVGSVQDAGLIFLSNIASQIVQHCYDATSDGTSNNNDPTVMLATVTIILGCCTTVLGISLIIIGHFQLAQYVQLLPTGVVGGYLAYIGWFCGVSGIGLMSNSSNVTFHSVFLSNDSLSNLRFIMPGLASGIAIYAAVRTLKHMVVLPTCIFVLMIVFHTILWYTETSIQEATASGWIRSFDTTTTTNGSNDPSSKPSWFHTWDYLQWGKVDWTVVTPKLILTELSMIFVVALSSSLDVAAIELELQEQYQLEQHEQKQQYPKQLQSSSSSSLPSSKPPLDYNRELQTIGISNLISGLTGGYTGSYIFSQSIFSLRAGIRSRISGYVLALCQLIVITLPVPILSYVPNFLFGALLTLICVDLLYEWLWHVRHKVSNIDYIIGWITFVSIQLFNNVEYGIVTGLLLHMLWNKLILHENLLFVNNVPKKYEQDILLLDNNGTIIQQYDDDDDDNNNDDDDDNDQWKGSNGILQSAEESRRPNNDHHHHPPNTADGTERINGGNINYGAIT